MANGSVSNFFDATGFGGFGTMPTSATTYTVNVSGTSPELTFNVEDDDGTFHPQDFNDAVGANSPHGTEGDPITPVSGHFKIEAPDGDTHNFWGMTVSGQEYFYSNTASADFFDTPGDYSVIHSGGTLLSSNTNYLQPVNQDHDDHLAVDDDVVITPPCFTSGSSITTDKGDVLIDDLCPGDMILTRDNGFQPLAWMYNRALSARYFNANPNNRPVMLAQGSLGPNVPDRDVMVSPGHLVLLANVKSGKESEVLVPARQLVKHDRAFQVKPLDTAYIHLLFEQHQVVKVDGMWSESFQPSYASLSMLGDDRNEVFELFPELQAQSGVDAYVAARDVAYRGHAARVLKPLANLHLQ